MQQHLQHKRKHNKAVLSAKEAAQQQQSRIAFPPLTCSERHVHQLCIADDGDAAPVDGVHRVLAVQVSVAVGGGEGGAEVAT